MEQLMMRDPYVDEDGVYRVRSLYFDDFRNSCYLDNINGTDPREKFRIRVYPARGGITKEGTERILLECKRREREKTLKTSCILTPEQAARLVLGRPFEHIDVLPPLLRKLELLRRNRLYHPTVIVEYDRIPYVYPSGNVRVTFDCGISSSSDIDRFFSPEIEKRPILPLGQELLEVKFDSFLPDPIYRAINAEPLERVAFSKYCLCRKYDLRGVR